MPTISEQKRTCLDNVKTYFEKTHNEFLKSKISQQLADIESVLFNARKTLEAISDYIILDKFPTTDCPHDGETVLRGKDNAGIKVDGHKTTGKNWSAQKGKIVAATRISIIHDRKFFSADDEQNDSYKFRFQVVRFGGNKGSHNETDENKNPSFNECEETYITLRGIIEWFHKTFLGSIQQWFIDIQNVAEINQQDIPKPQYWYSLEANMGGFADKFSHYFLVTFPNFRKKLSEYELNLFAKSRVEWNLVIDFDHEAQQKGLGLAFKNILGNEKMRTLLKGNEIPDFRGTYYFLAQGNSASDIVEKPTPWANTQGKALEKILNKIEVKKAFIVIIGNEPKLISKSIEIISRCYASVAKTTITLAIITDSTTDKQKIEDEINDEGHNENFLSIQYYHFEFSKLVNQGFGLIQKFIQTPEGEYVIPAYSEERLHIKKVISNSLYEDLRSKYIELVYEKIGKKTLEQTTDFYKGEEITWQDIAQNKGKDLERNKVNLVFIPELIELLQASRKGFYKYQINHEASAGGTTVAKRIAYEIGRGKLPSSFPTVLIKRYIPQETAKTLADLYEHTGDKPILAVVEEFEVGKILLQKLEDEIRSLQKTVVVLYVCRNNSQEEKESKVRRLPSALETDEIEVFEQTFSNLEPSRKSEIEGINKLEAKFVTPFMYGFTAFGKDFKKFEDYIKYVLNEIKPSIRVFNFLGFVALIDRYTQVPIPELLFHNYLEIPQGSSLQGMPYYEQLETLIYFTYNEDGKDTTLKMRNNLFTEEVSEIIVSGGNPDLRHNWRNNLKNKLLELIDIISQAYPNNGEPYSLDKKLVDALFLDKSNTSTDDREIAKFTKLITELGKISYTDAIEVLKKLADIFNGHSDAAFYSQHLARLYYESARSEQGLNNDTKINLYDNSIKYAQNAVKLYQQKNEESSSLYHTLGHAALLKLDFINKKISVDKDFQGIEDLYDLSSQALEECIKLNEKNTHGYLSYTRLIVTVLEIGRKKSGYDSFDKFFEDENFDWYVDKIDLGMELVTKSMSFWAKHNSNAKEDSQELENKRKTNTKQVFQDSIEYYHSKLLSFFTKHTGNALKKKDFDIRIQNAKTNNFKNLWQNAKVEFILSSKNFSNPQKGFEKVTLDELNEIVPLLKASLEYKPTHRDFKRWLQAVRHNLFSIDIETAKNFIEFVNKQLENDNNGNFLLRTEVSYYLYCLQAIQIINAGQSIDKEPLRKMRDALSFCKNKADKLSLNIDSSFEWLGNNQKDGFEQLIKKEKLGDFPSELDFFENPNLLREVSGTIKSVVNQSGRTRQAGEIQLDNCGLSAFFVPIKGGYIVKDSSIERCKFDNTKYLNTPVKFYLGFSYGRLQAYQPIPKDSIRVNNLKDNIFVKKADALKDTEIKFKVKNIDKPAKKISGYIYGSDNKQTIDIPFEEGKDYQDYKSWRSQIIFVKLNENGEYRITNSTIQI